MKRIIGTIILLLGTMASGCFTACIHEKVEHYSLLPGDNIPTVTIALHDGSPYQTGMAEREVIVFFNTKCPDCREELPTLNRFHELHPELAIVCIAREESAESIATFWSEHNLTLSYSPQQDRTIYDLFSTAGIPKIYFVHKGVVQQVYDDDPIPSLEQLEASYTELKSL